MTAVLTGLRADHAKFRTYLDLLEGELGKFRAGDAADYELIELLIQYFTSFPDEWHHRQEDRVYDALAAGSDIMRGSLDDLRLEHKRLANSVRRFGERIESLRFGQNLAMKTLVTAGEKFSGLMRNHMTKEDEVFFPIAEANINASDWAAIEKDLEDDLANSGLASKLDRIADIEEQILDIASDQIA